PIGPGRDALGSLLHHPPLLERKQQQLADVAVNLGRATAPVDANWRRGRVFVNGENLTGVRQTRFDPLLRPTRAADGRWTVDAWAPLEGTNVNGGLRVRF